MTARPRRFATPLLLAAFAVVAFALTTSTSWGAERAAAQTPGGVIRDQYVVVLQPGVDARLQAALAERAYGTQTLFVYEHALQGFTFRGSAQAATALARNPLVDSVEPDAVATIVDLQSPTSSWGLDRIDQRALPLNSAYSYANTGSGVTAYIIDTGIQTTHPDFGGRAVHGWDFVSGDADATDCNGHGTHVAGTVGGNSYGVAKGVTLVAVRVLNCSGSGSFSGVIAGIDWVTGHHQAGQPAVANMSLGGGAYAPVDTAVSNSIADGVTYAIAAGNDNANACNYSPARTSEAITVGATTSSDGKASYSNYGTCVDIHAPGSSITSAWLNNGSNTISGTSMAAPHVAGAAALQLEAGAVSPAAVEGALEGAATTGAVSGLPSGTPNLLLYASGPPPTPTHDVAVTGITAPAPVVQGGTANVSVAVTNQGTYPETFDITLTDTTTGAILVGLQEVTVSAGGSTNVAFSWAPLTVGDYELTATAENVAGETDTTDNVHSIAVTVNEPPAGNANNMLVGGIAFSKGGKHLNITVTVRRDSDADNVGESIDAVVSNARVYLTLTDGSSTWLANGTTSSDGTVRFQLRNARAGTYTATVTNVTHSTYPYVPTLNLETSDTYVLASGGGASSNDGLPGTLEVVRTGGLFRLLD
jgi:subtilisin family serine protease